MQTLRRISLIICGSFLICTACYANNHFEKSYENGLRFAINEKWDEADKEFKTVLKVKPFFMYAKECIKCIENLRDNKIRKDTAIHVFKGLLFFQQKLFGEALTEYNKAIFINSNYTIIYFFRGNTFKEKKLIDKAIEDYSKAIATNPNFGEAYYARGLCFVKKRTFKNDSLGLVKAIRKNPKRAESFTVKSGAAESFAVKNGAYEERLVHDKAIIDYNDLAINDFKSTIKNNLMVAESYNQLGLIYQDKDDYLSAITNFTDAITTDNEFLDAYVNRGILYAKVKGLHANAISDFNKALRIDPKNIDALNSRGISFLGTGKYDLAINDFMSVVDINPKINEAYTNLAEVYRAKRESGKAMMYVDKALKNDSADDIAYGMKAKIFMDQGNDDLAIKNFNHAINLNKMREVHYVHLAIIYGRNRKLDESFKLLDTAIQINPNNSLAFVIKGINYSMSGDNIKACKNYKRACELGDCGNYKIAKARGECK